MRVYNFVDIINGKVPFEEKMYSSRGFVVKTPLLFAGLDVVAELSSGFKAIKLYYFKILEGPNQVGNYYRYRLRMYYELLSSTI